MIEQRVQKQDECKGEALGSLSEDECKDEVLGSLSEQETDVWLPAAYVQWRQKRDVRERRERRESSGSRRKPTHKRKRACHEEDEAIGTGRRRESRSRMDDASGDVTARKKRKSRLLHEIETSSSFCAQEPSKTLRTPRPRPRVPRAVVSSESVHARHRHPQRKPDGYGGTQKQTHRELVVECLRRYCCQVFECTVGQWLFACPPRLPLEIHDAIEPIAASPLWPLTVLSPYTTEEEAMLRTKYSAPTVSKPPALALAWLDYKGYPLGNRSIPCWPLREIRQLCEKKLLAFFWPEHPE